MTRLLALLIALNVAGTSAAGAAATAASGIGNGGSSGVTRASFADRMLALHNRERAEVGSPPMQWDPSLAAAAASYGPALASLGRLQHSPRETRPGQRENLSMGASGIYDDQYLLGMWVTEKKLFTPGLFPNVSRDGRWEDVAHYTQMVWRGTTHVGCALHRGGGNDYLICRYSPPGNTDGKPVY